MDGGALIESLALSIAPDIAVVSIPDACQMTMAQAKTARAMSDPRIRFLSRTRS
jgi:hypothetical protein